MRVITGTARGRKLQEPKDMSVRPTTDMVKESMFSIIQFDVPGRRVLDLFAGTGQLGIEAVSRGAASCVFVDQDNASLSLVRANVAACGFGQQSQILRTDAQSYLKHCGQFDIVFLDPPYRAGLYKPVLAQIFQFDILSVGGIIVVESLRGEEMPETPAPYVKGKTYNYGKISVTIYTRQAD